LDAAAHEVLPDPLSPELVLVSPPEAARMARNLLSPPTPAARRSSPEPREPQLGSIELTAVWLFCLAVTLGPMLFTLLASG
jgi:hypothetical protein